MLFAAFLGFTLSLVYSYLLLFDFLLADRVPATRISDADDDFRPMS